MSKKTLLLGAIASIIAINSVVADTTVTSKQYVDNQDEAIFSELYKRKQNTIPATGTNANTPGSTVVTYTGTAGNIGERGIYDGSNEYDSSTDADKLVTASALQDIKGSIPSQFVTVTEKSCEEYIENTEHTDSNCLLWRFTNVDVLADCSDSKCDSK